MTRGPETFTSRRLAENYVPFKPGEQQAVALPNSQRPGYSPVYRHARFTDELLASLDPNITTVHESFEASATTYPANRCLGARRYDPATKTYGEYVWQDYQTVRRRRANFGSGLVQLHKQVGVNGDKYGVGLWCLNRPEWQITDLACMSQNLFTVSLYDTLGPDAVEYIISHVKLTCIVTSLQHAVTLLKIKPRLPSLKFIVIMESIDAGEKPGESKRDLLNSMAKDVGLAVYSMQEVETLGEAAPLPLNPPKPDDVTTINYTSGTTGNPKGVVLTHRNAIAGAAAGMLNGNTSRTDTLLSFLPLAHIYERVTEHGLLGAGGSIGYFHGDIAGVVDDAKVLRPTVFVAVPRLWNRFGAAMKAATLDAPGIKGALSRHVIGVKLANIDNPDAAARTNKHAIYDRVWAKKVAAAFGLDRARYMISGASPLDPELKQLLRVVFANHFAEGYGMTETYAATIIGHNGDCEANVCGVPMPVNEICLRDVPDMDYHSTDKPYPRGELMVRGNAVFREYFQNPEETAKTKEADGWMHTGDIAHIDELGRVKIIDRVKNLLKLAQGEYVSPERIENMLLGSLGWLAAAYVHGDGTQSSLVGLFGVAPDQFAPFASQVLGRQIAATDLKAVAEACRDPRVCAAAAKEMERVSRHHKANSYERVRACWLGIEPFTDDLVTPTFKLKRPRVVKHYRGTIDELYKQVNALPETKARL